MAKVGGGESGEMAAEGTVLVVDDDSSMRFLLKVVLEDAGFAVVEAAHGAAALRCVSESDLKLVITDQTMAVMDGGELIRRLRADPETARLPILMLSSSPDYGAGADAVLTKPFAVAELSEVVASLTGTAGMP